MLRLIFQFVASVVIGLVTANFAAWVYVRVYAESIGMPLHELSEDYGMGMLGMALQVGVFLLATIGLFAFFLHRAHKKQ